MPEPGDSPACLSRVRPPSSERSSRSQVDFTNRYLCRRDRPVPGPVYVDPSSGEHYKYLGWTACVYTGAVRDITSEVKAQEELARSKRELQRCARSHFLWKLRFRKASKYSALRLLMLQSFCLRQWRLRYDADLPPVPLVLVRAQSGRDLLGSSLRARAPSAERLRTRCHIPVLLKDLTLSITGFGFLVLATLTFGSPGMLSSNG